MSTLLLDYAMTSFQQLDKCESVRRNRKTDIFVSRSLPGDNLPRRVHVHCQCKTMSEHSLQFFMFSYLQRWSEAPGFGASIDMLIISFSPSFSNDAVNFQSPGLSETITISSTSELLNTGVTIVPLEAKGLPVQVFWAYEAQIDRADNANVSMCLYI